MKSKKRTIGILIVVIVILFGFACSLLIYRNNLASENTKNDILFFSSAPSGRSIENFYDKLITDEKIALEAIETNRDKLGYADKNFTFIYDEKSGSETAYHFDLYYKGIPVYSPVGIRGISVMTHLDNSADILMTGVSNSEKIRKVNTTPKITQDEAIKIAKSTMNMKSDMKLKLVLYEVNDTYVLAYYYCGTTICIINAENGEVITCHSNIVSSTDEFTGQNGDIHQVFYDDYEYENNYIKNALWDKEKNIFIYDNIHTKEEVKNKDKMITIDDLQSGKNKSAVDGMANTYRAVEYFEKHFNKKFNSTVVSINVDTWKDENDKVVTDNAGCEYFDIEGKKVAFLIFPFASDKKTPQYSAYLDMVAHEFTHAVTGSECFETTDYKDDNKYYECNALMEAYSDIFGELIEKEYTGQTDWKISSIRNLAEKEENTQYRYKYSERYTGTKDNGGAHLNSTIISHTAYLMSKSNDSNKYDTEFLLDYNQLSQLWYGSLEHLKKSEFKDFADCRYAVEKSARDLIKKGVLVKNNLKVIQQAFDEVGVSSNPIRRGAKDSAEIIEIEEIENYEWYLEPTIEADNIIVPDYDNELYEKYAIIEKNGKYGLISNKGKIEVECKYLGYSICSLENTYIMANKIDNNYISKSDDYKFENNKLVQSQHSSHDGDSIKYIYDKKENKAYIQDYGDLREYTGNEVYPAQEGLSKNESGYYKYYNTLGKWGIISGNKVMKDFEYSNGRYTDNLIALEKNNTWGYFDSNGKEIIPFIAERSNYINCEKYISSTYTFDNMAFMDVDGVIAINTKDGGSFYDIKGNQLTNPDDFEEVRPMINGFAWVKKDGKWGVIKLKYDNQIEELNSWQTLYSQYLSNGEYKQLGTGFANGETGEEHTLIDEDAKFQLAYIDNDDIPELIISGGYSVHIFTVKDNELIQLKKNDNNGKFSWYGCLYYREKEGMFLDSYQRMGAYRTPVYKLQNGECSLQANIEYYESVKSGEIVNQSFIIDNEEVSLDNYVNELKKWRLNTYFTEQYPEYNIENDNWKILHDSDGYEITESNINIIISDINNLKSENNQQNKGTVSIEDGYLNVRESPSTKGKIIGRLYNGDEITIEETSEDGKWLKISKSDIKGYVSSNYISKNGKKTKITMEDFIKGVNCFISKNWKSNIYYKIPQSFCYEENDCFCGEIRTEDNNSPVAGWCEVNKNTGIGKISMLDGTETTFNIKDYL